MQKMSTSEMEKSVTFLTRLLLLQTMSCDQDIDRWN
jgi:hypothetical protein